MRPSVVLVAVALTTGAAVVGVVRAVRLAVRLAPAEAMRPAPPATYRVTLVERLGLVSSSGHAAKRSVAASGSPTRTRSSSCSEPRW